MKAVKTLKILIFLIGVLLISSVILTLTKPAQVSQIPIIGDIVKYQSLEEPRRRFIGLIEDRFGYKLCGEYQLKHGVNAIDLFFIRNDTFACYYLFKLPEPREKYKLYDAWVVINLAPARPEDMNKTYYFGEGGGTYKYPHVWVNPGALAPFSLKADKPLQGGFEHRAPRPFTVENVDAGHSDVYAAVSYKPEEPGMPIKVLIEIYATVLTVDEKWDISYHKTPEYSDLGTPRGDISETLNREVRRFLESLGYEFCGEYNMRGELEIEVLNITYIVDKPYEGKACYFIINLPDYKPAIARYFWNGYPVSKTNMSKISVENHNINMGEGYTNVRDLFWIYFKSDPAIERMKPYSHTEFMKDWGGGDPEDFFEEVEKFRENPIDWPEGYNLRYMVLFYFKASSDKPIEDLAVVYSAVLFFKYVEVEELGPP
ncbi:MAG: hypothetical protein QXG12_04790 [Thermoproteota archaeon]